MSITSENYQDWCDAVTRTNETISELYKFRKENYAWMKTQIEDFFKQLGEISKIHFKQDASEIEVSMKGEVDLNIELLGSLPFKFNLVTEEGLLIFTLKPDVIPVSV